MEESLTAFSPNMGAWRFPTSNRSCRFIRGTGAIQLPKCVGGRIYGGGNMPSGLVARWAEAEVALLPGNAAVVAVSMRAILASSAAT